MKEKIPRRATRCFDGGEPLESGSEYISVLTESDGEWMRADYCLECWKKYGDRERTLFWKGKIPFKKKLQHTPDEKALELFRTIEEPHLLSVLALYLQRRNQIAQRRDTYYEILETGEVLMIPSVTLSSEERKKAGEQLVKLLDRTSQ